MDSTRGRTGQTSHVCIVQGKLILVSNDSLAPVLPCLQALQYKKYSTASDVWSFGCLMYEIWSLGYKPFEGHTNSQVHTQLPYSCHIFTVSIHMSSTSAVPETCSDWLAPPSSPRLPQRDVPAHDPLLVSCLISPVLTKPILPA